MVLRVSNLKKVPRTYFMRSLKEERSGGGTVDWPFMLCILNVMQQVRLGECSLHRMKIAFMPALSQNGPTKLVVSFGIRSTVPPLHGFLYLDFYFILNLLTVSGITKQPRNSWFRNCYLLTDWPMMLIQTFLVCDPHLTRLSLGISRNE